MANLFADFNGKKPQLRATLDLNEQLSDRLKETTPGKWSITDIRANQDSPTAARVPLLIRPLEDGTFNVTLGKPGARRNDMIDGKKVSTDALMTKQDFLEKTGLDCNDHMKALHGSPLDGNYVLFNGISEKEVLVLVKAAMDISEEREEEIKMEAYYAGEAPAPARPIQIGKSLTL